MLPRNAPWSVYFHLLSVAGTARLKDSFPHFAWTKRTADGGNLLMSEACSKTACCAYGMKV